MKTIKVMALLIMAFLGVPASGAIINPSISSEGINGSPSTKYLPGDSISIGFLVSGNTTNPSVDNSTAVKVFLSRSQNNTNTSAGAVLLGEVTATIPAGRFSGNIVNRSFSVPVSFLGSPTTPGTYYFVLYASGTGGSSTKNISFSVVTPEIAVESPPGTGLASNGTSSFGPVPTGVPLVRTITIRNTGTGSLSPGVPSISTGNSGDYTITSSPASTVAAGSSTTLNVRFTPAATGTRSSRLSIPNSDADESPYIINLTGTGTLPVPEIEVVRQVGGAVLVDGSSAASFGSLPMGGSTTLGFIIRNIGTGVLTGISLSIDGPDNADFIVTASPNASVDADGYQTTFTIWFSPRGPGLRSATLRIASNDADENPFDIALTGTGLAPEIKVELGSSDIASDGLADFGAIPPGGVKDLVFTIRNTGDAALTLDGATKVVVGGLDAAMFAVIAQPSSPVAASSGATSFTVRFTPAGSGPREAFISIASNDTDEGTFTVRLAGRGESYADLYQGVAAMAGLSGPDAGAGATPFGDGVANLLKYAFNMNLASADSRTLAASEGTVGLPSILFSGSGAEAVVTIKYIRRKDSGLIYEAQHSTGLEGESFSTLPATPAVTPIDDKWERVTLEHSVDPATTAGSFYRVKVTLP